MLVVAGRLPIYRINARQELSNLKKVDTGLLFFWFTSFLFERIISILCAKKLSRLNVQKIRILFG